MISVPFKDKNEIVLLIENRIIGKNAERNRKILYRRLIDGIGYENLAEEFGLSVRQTKNICYKEIQRLL